MSADSWLGKLIYLILIDRFYNGDRSNDDFGKGEYNPKDDNCFQGGDLKGVIQKLPYIRKMGFDAIWITPPVHNQWVNSNIAARGYHGYWAYDFTAVDPHFGNLEDYKALVRRAHALDLKVIQDIVVNHTGNYFTVDERGWREIAESYPPKGFPKAPKDPVFCMNNPNVPEHKQAAVYNFTPNISDFNNRKETLTYTLGDLDDINLRSPLAAKRLREIYRYWIDQVRPDGLRVDTVYYTPEDFYEGFLYGRSPGDLGIKCYAQKKGMKDFFVFGEVWSYDYKAINKYLRGGAARRLDSALDFPLNEALAQVFYQGAPTQLLEKPLRAKRHNRGLWVNFLDNHDIERVASRADWPSVQQSLLALFTLPGIPCVYYGTEAGLKGVRQNMFQEKYFRESKRHAFLRKLARLRKSHPALYAGKFRMERTSLAPGVLSYSMSRGGSRYWFVFNTSAERMVYDFGALGSGAKLLLSSAKAGPMGGAILAPKSYFVLKAGAQHAPARDKNWVRMQPLRPGHYRERIRVRFKLGYPEKISSVYLLSNDNYDRKIPISNFRSGAFALDSALLGNGKHRVSLLAQKRSGALHVSNPTVIEVRNRYRLLREAVLGKNKRVTEGLRLPADPSYDGQLSMRRVRAYTSGRDLRLELRMASVTDIWNPPHGYDHVYFNIFFDFPGRPGKKFFPKLNYARSDFDFNLGFLLHGWDARSFGARDSTRDLYGLPRPGDVEETVDKGNKTITFTFSSRYFDALRSLSGIKIFIATWDGYLGDLRPISDKREDWKFYVEGVDGAQALPKVFDHVLMRI